jgi:TRAP-type C4-dicarboxylate transport system permease small subunit
MKVRIERLPPHQNAKTLASVLAVLTLVAVLLMLAFGALSSAPNLGSFGATALMSAPINWILTYLVTAFACVVYNSLFKYTGGFEFDHD